MNDLIQQLNYDSYMLPTTNGLLNIGISIFRDDYADYILWSYIFLYTGHK